MKHIVLSIIGFVLSLATFAANPTNAPHLFCDFESPNTLPASAFHIPDGGAVDVSIVANPYPSGINTSDTVLKIISPSGANWGGAIFNEVSHGEDLMMNLYQVHKVTGYDLVSLLMYRENNTHVPQLKTVDIDDDGHTSVNYLDLVPLSVDGDENYVANHTITTHQWQRVVYSVTHCHNSGIHFIYIMPDREGSSTVYIDDIIFEKDDEKPVMVSATCGTASGTSMSLNVSATDDLTDPVTHFLVATDGNLSHAQEYTASNGMITVTGLTPNTSYTFTVWAKDYAGNVSDNYKTTTCNTEAPHQGNWCDKELTINGHTIYVSCEDLGGTYRLTIESNETMTGLGGSYCHINGNTAYLYGLYNATVSNNGHTITCDIVSTEKPNFYTPLYVLYPGEVVFSQLPQQSASIEWGICDIEPQCEPTSGDTTAYVCAGKDFYWHGELAHDGDQRTYRNVAGCDSIVTLHLIEDNITTSDTADVICRGSLPYRWHGKVLNDAGQLKDTIPNGANCDSIITLTLTVKEATASDTTAHVCPDEDFYWHGSLAHDGDQITLENAAGCDSIITLHLIIDECAPECEDIIMRKWDDLIFIGNGEHLYVSYQWYRDGQALTGETGQYLYIMGYTLENDGHTYSARAYKADGTYIEACSKSFTDFQRSAELYPGDHSAVQMSPNPARRFMPVTIKGLSENPHFIVFSAVGQRVAEIMSDTFVAEWPVGYYLIYSLDSEHPWTGKLLVY